MKKVLVLLILSMFLLASCYAPEQKVGETSLDSKEQAGESVKNPEEDVTEDAPKVEIGLIEGKMAPDFTLKDIEGKDVSLSDYRGKTVIVNFFGVWCPWCKLEMPGLIKTFEDYKDKGLELLVVDVGDTKETLISYLEENNYNIKAVMDEKQEVAYLYRVNSYPASFILDEQGIILKVHRGFLDEELLKTYLDTVIE